MPETDLFAELILPVPLDQFFTYHVPDDMAELCVPGKRAVVQFGRKKIYSAIIYRTHYNKPTDYKTKGILSILDDEPIINEFQFKFWEWIADYYLCSIGEVYRAALPAGLKLESHTSIKYNDDFFEFDESPEDLVFSEKENVLLDTLRENRSLKISDVNELLSLKNSLKYVKSLYDKGAIKIEESLTKNYKTKKETYLCLAENFQTEDALNISLESLNRAKKQKQLFISYLELIQFGKNNQLQEISQKELLNTSGSSSSVLKQLEKKGILLSIQKEISRLDVDDKTLVKAKELNKAQIVALKSIKDQFKNKETVLLHGVTSSGKTEVYIHLIQETIKKGKQVLYLLPEIALSTQLIHRLKKHFGNQVGVYHSKFNDAERVEIWQNIQNSSTLNNQPQYKIILGVRSSVFLPYSKLGLIIIDEEHENTFKQYNPAPRYQARDAALVLAQIHGAKTLLGTATPSIESYFNAKTGKYGLVELNTRYQDIELPEILLADIKEARRKKQMKSHFTPLLLEHIENTLKNQGQIILFQNRRGYAPYLECTSCNSIPKCKHCDVSLTYHRHTNQLVCHYCGYAYTNKGRCEECGSTSIRTRGFGTEKVEDELTIFFSHAVIQRMDLDTTRGKKSHEQIIQKFETGNIDILIGTQMVTKGLDFDNVGLVGILDADQMLNFPDFRAYERSYQLMAQVSGRAGRKNKRGKVIIQTTNAKNEIIKDVINNNYQHMFLEQLKERKQFKYPPFNRLIYITLKHKNKQVLDKAATVYAQWLKKLFNKNILGPEYPIINRTHDLYLKSIIIKLDKSLNINSLKKNSHYLSKRLIENNQFKNIQMVFDVDPQ
ncbi:MAG: primosomal protein N' [Bacteroidetes bacterium]|nr:MAG: primosomal protein N' [Bacteroidota bacterium]